jgi:hypothetical protein
MSNSDWRKNLQRIYLETQKEWKKEMNNWRREIKGRVYHFQCYFASHICIYFISALTLRAARALDETCFGIQTRRRPRHLPSQLVWLRNNTKGQQTVNGNNKKLDTNRRQSRREKALVNCHRFATHPCDKSQVWEKIEAIYCLFLVEPGKIPFAASVLLYYIGMEMVRPSFAPYV